MHPLCVAASNNLNHVLTILVENPFTQTLAADIVQDLPPEIQVVEANGGTVSNRRLTWPRTVQPEQTTTITATIRYNGAPGSSLTLPKAQMSAFDAVNLSTVSFQGQTPTIESPSALAAQVQTPSRVNVNQPVNVTLDLRNLDAGAIVTGNVTATLKELSGRTISQASLEIALAPSERQSKTLTTLHAVSATRPHAGVGVAA